VFFLWGCRTEKAGSGLPKKKRKEKREKKKEKK
jgi:hypothetical protein